MSQRRVLLRSEEKFQRRMMVVRAAMSQGTQAASYRFGVSERTVRSWKRRFKKGGSEGLRDKSRRPLRIKRKDADGVMTSELIRLHDCEPGLNRMQVLQRLFILNSDEVPTLSWIGRTRRRHRLSRKREERKSQHKMRYEIPIPGALQVDTKYVEKVGEKGEHLYQFTAIDECSRVRFLGGSLTKGAEAARKFLVRAIEYYRSVGVEVWRVQTDNGTEFTMPRNEQTLDAYIRGSSKEHVFTAECESRGIRHRLIKVATPELNGKVERSHRIDGERFYSRFEFSSEYGLDHALKNIWMPEYNEQRPHGSLGYKTPMDFLKSKLKALQPEELKIMRQSYEQRKVA